MPGWRSAADPVRHTTEIESVGTATLASYDLSVFEESLGRRLKADRKVAMDKAQAAG